jgi:hypothetical protein
LGEEAFCRLYIPPPDRLSGIVYSDGTQDLDPRAGAKPARAGLRMARQEAEIVVRKEHVPLRLWLKL